jgi:HK97 family phage prohead protease
MKYDSKISASMRERKRMAFALQVKSIDSDGRFAGYASVFDVIDNQKDVMMKGAFASTLKKGAGGIKLLWQHQQDEPIGVFEKVFEDKVGLYVEGRLLLDVQKAREAHALLKAGAVSGLSIGYSPVRYKINAETGVRILAEVDLFEISLVTFPANNAATVTVVKSDAVPHELIALSDAIDKAFFVLRT